jgi:hypothetical protein
LHLDGVSNYVQIPSAARRSSNQSTAVPLRLHTEI